MQDTLCYLAHETPVWLEVTTLLIPGHNDADAELRELASWYAAELGPDVPLHFSAFHPDHRMRDVPPTPTATLVRAREIALEHGLRYVYTGNVRNLDGDTTWCPGCGTPLIVRDWYRILDYRLTRDGRCPRCGLHILGRFAETADDFGPRRIPVRIRSG